MATLRGLVRAGQEIARLGLERGGPRRRGARRQGGAGRVRPLAGAGGRRVLAHRGTAQGQLRAHHRALRGGRRRHRARVRLPRARQAHLRLPARQPDRRRRPSEHGQVGVRPLRRRQPGRPPGDPGRAVHAGDVEDGGHAAADVLRGEGRVAAAAHRQARAGGLAAADERLRQAREGARLRRRHRLDHADGDPLEGAAAEDARAEPRADHRRLPAADDLRPRRRRTACRRSRRSRAR